MPSQAVATTTLRQPSNLSRTRVSDLAAPRMGRRLTAKNVASSRLARKLDLMPSVVPAPRRGGRPTVGPKVQLNFPPELLARVDAAAARSGVTRSEMIRRACQMVLP